MRKIIQHITKRKCLSYWTYCFCVGLNMSKNYYPFGEKDSEGDKNEPQTILHFYLILWRYSVWVTDLNIDKNNGK